MNNNQNNNLLPHKHDKCEIYINLSGDVSILVEDSIYPMERGCVCITRPGERHRCIYHNNGPHEHYWILFSPTGNEKLLNLFYSRPIGQNNLLILPFESSKKLISLCSSLISSKFDELKTQLDFWSIIYILSNNSQFIDMRSIQKFPDVTLALNYINKHFTEAIDYKFLAANSNVSISTLERHFTVLFNTTPREYVKQQRLSYASELLKTGESVSDVALKSGFTDYSSFISFFKKQFGITPLKYQKLKFFSD